MFLLDSDFSVGAVVTPKAAELATTLAET